MSDDLFSQVDDYVDGLFGPPDPALSEALERSAAAGLPPISVSPSIGRFLHVLALAIGARRILEVGTLGGYSAIWLARALPDGGELVSLELDPEHAALARESVSVAGLAGRVDIRVGRGVDLLAALARDGATFDMVFIDADKPSYPEYLEGALRVARPGTLIVADNVVREGRVASGPSDDPMVTGAQHFNAALTARPELSAAIIQVTGVKGHDGMALAVVRDAGTTP